MPQNVFGPSEKFVRPPRDVKRARLKTNPQGQEDALREMDLLLNWIEFSPELRDKNIRTTDEAYRMLGPSDLLLLKEEAKRRKLMGIPPETRILK